MLTFQQYQSTTWELLYNYNASKFCNKILSKIPGIINDLLYKNNSLKNLVLIRHLKIGYCQKVQPQNIMRIKTIIIVLVTILLTVVLMQNTDPVFLKFLWATFRISELWIMAIIALIGFILGYLTGRPSRVKRLGVDFANNDIDKTKPNTLSDEDKDYIS
jgi:uncharacterized integral membrane protein